MKTNSRNRLPRPGEKKKKKKKELSFVLANMRFKRSCDNYFILAKIVTQML